MPTRTPALDNAARCSRGFGKESYSGSNVLLPLDVVALRLIKDEGVAEVRDITSDGDVVGGNPVDIEDVGDVVGRVEVAGIVHHVIGQPLQHS